MSQQIVINLSHLEDQAAATVNGVPVAAEHVRDPWIGSLRATKVSGTGNLDAKIQDGLTPTGPWNDVCVFTQLTDSGGEVKTMSRSVLLPHKRAVVTVDGTGVYDVDVDLVGQT